MLRTPTAVPPTCPRCRGRLIHAHDPYGAYASCLTCGFVQEGLTGPAIGLADDTGRRRRREPNYKGRQL